MGIQCNPWPVSHVHQKEAGAERENIRTRVCTYLAFNTFFASYIFTVHLPRRLRIVVIGHLHDDVSGITKLKCRRKNEEDSGCSSKMTLSCK